MSDRSKKLTSIDPAAHTAARRLRAFEDYAATHHLPTHLRALLRGALDGYRGAELSAQLEAESLNSLEEAFHAQTGVDLYSAALEVHTAATRKSRRPLRAGHPAKDI